MASQFNLCLALSILVFANVTAVRLDEQEDSADFSPVGNELAKIPTADDCLVIKCGMVATRGEFVRCASLHCRQVSKKWIDTTHYSEGRRSVLDSLERCIRLSCHGKGGLSLKQCAFACSGATTRKTRRSSSVETSVGKRWVDPLNYGMGDDKRSTPLGGATNGLLGGKQISPSVCQQLCDAVEFGQSRPYFCQLRCQRAIDDAVGDY
ncbi:hypothetical protein LSH36_628g03080 [Paralvinella palmiformis]|uniref:Secreted protein n=1 Tax=Paralvinella palmiformis TaxID=53620 RepID=A0AAD9J4C6_9ANNE|nr:hypothetical protein LSH36_628g03080 [Paralvinella palmiformis]